MADDRGLRVELRHEARLGRRLGWLTIAVAAMFALADIYIGIAFHFDGPAAGRPRFPPLLSAAPDGTWPGFLVLAGVVAVVGLLNFRVRALALVGLLGGGLWFSTWVVMLVQSGTASYVPGVYAPIVFMHALLAVVVPQVRKVEAVTK